MIIQLIYSYKQSIFFHYRLLQAEGTAKEDSQTSMQHENTSLRATISRQSQKIGRIENELRKNELLLKDQGELQSTVEKQREKIIQYQREIEETKLHMARLEELVHQVQEQSMKEHVTTTPSVSVFFFKSQALSLSLSTTREEKERKPDVQNNCIDDQNRTTVIRVKDASS